MEFESIYSTVLTTILFTVLGLFILFVLLSLFMPNVFYFFSLSLNCIVIGVALLVFPFFAPILFGWMVTLTSYIKYENIKIFFNISIQNKLFLQMIFLFALWITTLLLSCLIYFLVLKRFFITVFSYKKLWNVLFKLILSLPVTFFCLIYFATPSLGFFSQEPDYAKSKIWNYYLSPKIYNINKNLNIGERINNSVENNKLFDVKELVLFDKKWTEKNTAEKILYLKNIDQIIKNHFPETIQESWSSADIEIEPNTKKPFSVFLTHVVGDSTVIDDPVKGILIKQSIKKSLSELIMKNIYLFIFVPELKEIIEDFKVQSTQLNSSDEEVDS